MPYMDPMSIPSDWLGIPEGALHVEQGKKHSLPSHRFLLSCFHSFGKRDKKHTVAKT